MENVLQKPQDAHFLESVGATILRYGLVLVVAWVGCLKFTAYEAEGVFQHASHSPLLSWAYRLLSVREFSSVLGFVELTLAALIALRPVWPRASAFGSLGGIAMFLTTLTFLITTPGVWQEGYGFPALSGSPGQFLAKDVVPSGRRARRCARRTPERRSVEAEHGR